MVQTVGENQGNPEILKILIQTGVVVIRNW